MKKGSQIMICTALCFTFLILGMFVGRSTIGGALTAEPRKSYTPLTVDPSDAADFQSGMININTADVEKLTMLPGIGEVIAQRIVDYREQNGPFLSIDDLMNVEGIGESRLTSITKYITIGE